MTCAAGDVTDGCLSAPPFSGCNSGSAFWASSGTPFRRAARHHASCQRPSTFYCSDVLHPLRADAPHACHSSSHSESTFTLDDPRKYWGLLVSTHSERVRMHHKPHYARSKSLSSALEAKREARAEPINPSALPMSSSSTLAARRSFSWDFSVFPEPSASISTM